MGNQSRPHANPVARLAIGAALILMCELLWLMPSLVKAATQRTPTEMTDAR